MTARTHLVLRRLSLAPLLAGLLLGSAVAVHAQSSTVRTTVVDAQGETVSAIEAEGLYPTMSVEHVVIVAVDTPAPDGQRLEAEIVDLQDHEHGCLRPEIRAGDITCGPGPDQGELSEQLEVTWRPGLVTPAGTCVLGDPVASGQRLRALAGARVALGTFDAAERRCFGIEQHFLDLPENNLAQGDSSSFDLRVRVSQDLDDEDVLGVVIERPEASEGTDREAPRGAAGRDTDGDQALGRSHDRGAGGLAHTGHDLAVIAGAAGIALLLGVGLLRRRRTTTVGDAI